MAKAEAVETAEETEIDYTDYLNLDPSGLQAHLADWIIEQTGITFASKAAEAAFREGVRLTTQLRMHHQKSPENRQRLDDLVTAREERNAAHEQKLAAKAARREAEPEEKPAKSSKAKAAPVEAAPVTKKAGKGKAAAPVAEAAPVRRRGPKASAGTSAAPF